MKLSKEYFGLQIKYCKKYAELSGDDFFSTLYLHSDFFNRLWIGRVKGDVSSDFQKYVKNPKWEEFLKKHYNPSKPVESCYKYYLKELKKNLKKNVSCFRYEIEEGKFLRFHANMYYRENKHSPLSIKNIELRRKEMKKILEEVKIKYPRVNTVKGHSWLYQIEAYRRLFPKKYLKNAKEVHWTLQGFSLWGQFLDKKGHVKKDLSKEFLMKVNRAKSTENLWNAFPLMPLDIEGSIKDFYKMYDI